MNILLLGSGGRECALAWKIAQSNLCSCLFIAPGNAGTAAYGENVQLSPNDFEAVKHFCIQHQVDLVLPGSEDPLVNGIYDFFKNDISIKHIFVAGPSQTGAQLEGSKAFAKKFMQRHNIPTADYREFSTENFEEGLRYIEQHSMPVVLKADGLAAGKGVVITHDPEEAKTVFHDMIREAKFGTAGKKVVIESFLSGIELSVFVMTDGKHYVLLPEAKDYKRIGEGDTGPNTGGMGAVSPVPFFRENGFDDLVIKQIIEPTVRGLEQEQISYRGFIFFGLIAVEGKPYVIEYNCRMGDPETEVVMPRLENDLVEMLRHMQAGTLDQVAVKHKPESAGTVMLVSEGYPGNYEKGKKISGLNKASGSLLFHAGTINKEHEIYTNGGRVLAVTAYGNTIGEALQEAYKNVEQLSFEGKNFRRDIGYEFTGTNRTA